MKHPKEYALNQYKDAVKAYCSNQKSCSFCIFKDREDENGDSCPFYVQPVHFDKVYPEEKNCYSCEYGKKAVYCSYDDQYCEEADAEDECSCWREKDEPDYYAACAENATVEDASARQNKMEFIRCKDCAFFDKDYCSMHNHKADGESLSCPNFLVNMRKIELMEE